MSLIRDKKTLNEWLAEDKKFYKYPRANVFIRLLLRFVSNPLSDESVIWSYIKCLRFLEYHLNKCDMGGKINVDGLMHSPYHFIMSLYYLHRLNKLSYKTGFQIPPNVCGPGLNIYHFGPIIINTFTQIGKNVTLYPGVLMGWKKAGGPCPIIGDNVFIGSGAKIIGGVHIGNNVTIGQNCVVVKDIADGKTIMSTEGRFVK